MPADRSSHGRLLVVEDDPERIALLQAALEHGGFASETVSTNTELAGLLETGRYDGLLISLREGLIEARLHWLRDTFDIPIAVLAGDGSEAERIEAFDAGADQVITRSMMPGELLARVRAMLRRAAPHEESGLVLDRSVRTVRHGDRTVALTPAEFFILECLIRKKRSVASRAELIGYLREPDRGREISSLETIISKLRRKLRQLDYAVAIVAVRGQGWILREPGQERG